MAPSAPGLLRLWERLLELGNDREQTLRQSCGIILADPEVLPSFSFSGGTLYVSRYFERCPLCPQE
jgi:hypothetical protein